MYRLVCFDSGAIKKIPNLVLLNRRSPFYFYSYHVKRYIYNSISFALESTIITYATIKMGSVLQHWFIFNCFVMLQVGDCSTFTNNGISYVKSTLQCYWNNSRRYLCKILKYHSFNAYIFCVKALPKQSYNM